MSFWRCAVTALVAVLAVTDATAQTVPVLGYVAAKNANPKRVDVFKQGLTELGHVEGKTIRIEYREAVLDAEYHGVMAELVDRKIDVILAANVAATVAAAKATNTIPIVMLAVFDPVGIGVVKSLERPGTNVTGTTMYAPQLIGERLRILKRIVPDLDKVAMALSTATMSTTPRSSNCCVRKRGNLASTFSRWTFASPRTSMRRLIKRWHSARRRW
jgi:putative tryptophan/tyrosine transport system substrate-binding protein